MTDTTLYEGREQTLIKHFLFERYFERFAHIVGPYHDSITFVDGFSGPWEARSADFKDTSFGIALNDLRRARETMKTRGKTLKLRCFFIEKDREKFNRLEEHAKQNRADVEIQTYNGEFEAAIPAILDFIKAGGKTFPFIFIDPTGWTGFAMDRITPLLQLPTLEVMINFMTGHVRRFIKDHPTADFTPLFGRNVRPLIQNLDGADLDDAAVALYSEELARRGKFKYVVPAIVLNPLIDRTHFHLIYATRHAKGLEVFKQAERDTVKVMNTTRADAKMRGANSDQGLLFTNETVVGATHVDELRTRYNARAKKQTLELIRGRETVSFDEVWECALKDAPLTWDADLQSWLKDWQAQGLKIIGLTGRERTCKVGVGHKLSWPRATQTKQ